MREHHWAGKVLLILFLLFMYLPVAVTIPFSFNESKLTSVWTGFSFKWYLELFRDRDLWRSLLFSLVLGFLSCLFSAVIGVCGAVGAKRAPDTLPARICRRLGLICTAPLLIPEIILGSIYLVTFSLMRLPFGPVTLLLAHMSFCIPYYYIVCSARLDGMDPSLMEAARCLGAGRIRALLDIMIPYLAPALLTGSLLSFAMSFDDVIISVFVTGVGISTLPVKIYSRMKFGVTPEINALCTLLLPVLLVLFLISRKGSKLRQ